MVFTIKKKGVTVKDSKAYKIYFFTVQARKTYFSTFRGATRYVFIAFVVKNIVRNLWQTSFSTNVLQTSNSPKSTFPHQLRNILFLPTSLKWTYSLRAMLARNCLFRINSECACADFHYSQGSNSPYFPIRKLLIPVSLPVPAEEC